jgi:phosphoribosyl-AMP cyclohydrolase
MTELFHRRISVEQVEEGNELAPKFDENGLLPCVTTSAKTGEVLMLGYMNEEALRKTIETGEAHYYSRSREKSGIKGLLAVISRRLLICALMMIRTRCGLRLIWKVLRQAVTLGIALAFIAQCRLQRSALRVMS